MSHADTLRHIAADEPFGIDMVLEHPNKTALLAGAAALDALTRVQDVMALITREWPEMDRLTYINAPPREREATNTAQDILAHLEDALGDTP